MDRAFSTIDSAIEGYLRSTDVASGDRWRGRGLVRGPYRRRRPLARSQRSVGGRPPALRGAGLGVVVLCASALTWLCAGIAHGMNVRSPNGVLFFYAVAIGYLAADLLSGMIEFGRAMRPLLTYGPRVRAVEGVEPYAPSALAIAGAAVLFLDLGGGGLGTLLGSMAFVISGLLLAGPYLRWWSYAPEVPRPIALLQRMGLLLSPERRWKQRKEGFAGYCAISGLWNRPLAELRVFPRLGRRLATLSARVAELRA